MIELAVVAAALLAFVCLGAAAALKRRAGLADYILAGRTLTLPMFVVTLVPTFYGGVLGVGEFAWSHGLSNWLIMAAPYYVFAAAYALWLAGRVRLEPGLTLPAHLERAYGRRTALLGALLFFILACPADELLMAGILLAHLSHTSLAWSTTSAAAASFIVLRRGGLRADVWANRLQFILMFGGFALIFPFALKVLGGPTTIAKLVPAGHLSFTGELGFWRIASWWLIALWTFVDPAFHQRCAAAGDPRIARHGILISIGFWALFDVMTTAAGLYARAALPNLADPLMAFPALAERVMPPLARGIFFSGLAASIFAALQGKSLLSAISLGKDAWGRWRQSNEQAQELSSSVALAAVLIFSFVLARLVPSVVDLWYLIGSAAIPGLLLPLLGIYFSRWRVGSSWALGAAAAGLVVSGAWLVWGRIAGVSPLGLEPMFPGLGASILVWIMGLNT